MKNKQIISPIGLKGNQIHERQLSLMGIKPINESENKGNHAVELTKIGPDGNAYAIIRENHEYYIKKTDKTTGLMLEDFKYIGGLQNKKNEAYPSYAKAIKQLNLKFKSLSEAYNRGGDINVFEDDNLLEHHPLKADMALSATKGIGDNQEYVVDKKGTPLSNKAKVGKEKGQFGDNLADGKACDDCEEVKVNEGFAGYGFTNESNLEEELNEYEQAIEEMMARESEPFGDEDEDKLKKEDMNEEDYGPSKHLPKFKDYEDSHPEIYARMLANWNRTGKNIFFPLLQLDMVDWDSSIEGHDFWEDVYDGRFEDAYNFLKYHGDKLSEELHGDQDKLDVAEPKGKLTRADFTALSAMEESIKRLDALLEGELKKKALK